MEGDPAEAILHQDTLHKVFMGPVADPLYPAHPGPAESEEDELTRAALEDPAGPLLHMTRPSEPTLWRGLAVVGFAVFSLAAVFWWFR